MIRVLGGGRFLAMIEPIGGDWNSTGKKGNVRIFCLQFFLLALHEGTLWDRLLRLDTSCDVPGEVIPIVDSYPGPGYSAADGTWTIETCYDGGSASKGTGCNLDYTW
jgi:hypothetical protein